MSADTPLRILLTVDAVGGVWQYGLELARALSQHGASSVIACLGPAPSPVQRAEVATVPSSTFIDTGLPLDWLSDGPEQIRAAGAEIARIAAAQRVDIAQLNMPTLAAAHFAMPVVAVAHGCVSTWWESARPGEPLDPMFGWLHALTAEALRKADLVVAPTAAYAAAVGRCYSLPEQPSVVHNGRHPVEGGAAAMHDCAITVGRLWDRAKNAELLDRVAGRLPFPFHAAGMTVGPHGEAVILRHLNPLGQLGAEALNAQLAARPVFVSAASFEPFGLAVLEAAQAGCALVLSDTPSFRELWDGAAEFVPTFDESAYSDAIRTIIGDATLRQRLGEAARERAGRYTPSATAAGMLNLFRGLLARRTDKRVAA